MKTWQHYLIAFFLGIIATCVLYIIARQPVGEPVVLLPMPTEGPILVDVAGAVNRPGVYALPPDSRVFQAIEMAGGFSTEADPNSVNKALRLNDENRVYVAKVGELQAKSSAGLSAADRTGVSLPKDTSSLVDINTATAAQFQDLPGIGPTRAADIVNYREKIGAFATLEQLMDVPGIGPTTFEQIRPLLTLTPAD
ncbi:helix-hairpin-helix domain-containing protein [Levilinea saccharolytica]|uniref:helix-hairpin-helix domain-containing protein n=1 Tax=Levilinea saccharolytica TaxID=229921 RepID=UPI000783312C|nr:helix-hairpin-helix domain-containing protein [Levilinea saccharolytica]GAP18086.1 competence protein ComEA helix-hairpin-helix repeat region [Levilinea saccharolytica]